MATAPISTVWLPFTKLFFSLSGRWLYGHVWNDEWHDWEHGELILSASLFQYCSSWYYRQCKNPFKWTEKLEKLWLHGDIITWLCHQLYDNIAKAQFLISWASITVCFNYTYSRVPRYVENRVVMTLCYCHRMCAFFQTIPSMERQTSRGIYIYQIPPEFKERNQVKLSNTINISK